MMNITRTSKFLSLILRHKPDTFGVQLDPQGWIEIDLLLKAMGEHGHAISRAQLEEVVATNEKRRFTIEDNRIRANQGHSISVDLELTAEAPPAELFHGTATRILESIEREGLKKMQRHHVHLSSDPETATQVGRRHGKPVVLLIDSAAMALDGYEFFLSANGVWLVDHVPKEYLRVIGKDA